jgi:hypothetical protein
MIKDVHVRNPATMLPAPTWLYRGWVFHETEALLAVEGSASSVQKANWR